MIITWLFFGLLVVSSGFSQVIEPNEDVVANGFMDEVYELWEAFERARQIGKEELEKLLNDERVQKTLDSLKGYARTAALRVVQFFKDQLERLGRDDGENDYIILRELWDLLSKAAVAGRDALKRMIADSKIRIAAAKLGNYARETAIKMLEFFENKLIEMDETEEVSTFMFFDYTEMTVSDILKELEECHQISPQKVLEFLNSEKLQQMLESIPPSLRKFIQNYIEKLRNRLQESDESSFMGDVDSFNNDKSWGEILSELRVLLTEAMKLGKENLLEVIESERVQNLLEKLPRFAKSIAQKLIEKLKSTDAYLLPIMEDDDGEVYSNDKSWREILVDLQQVLYDAMKLGKQNLLDVIESEKVKNLIDQLPPFAKSLAERLIEKVKAVDVFLPLNGSDEEILLRSPSIREKVQEIFDKVREGAKNGVQKLKEILNDKEFLDKVKSLPNRIRENFLEYVEKMKEMIEEKTEGGIVEEFQGYNIMDKLREIFEKSREAAKQGRDRFLELVNDPEFQEKIKNLPLRLREKIQDYLEKLRDMIEAQVGKENIEKIADFLRDAYQRGQESLKEALKSERLQELLSKLNGQMKDVAEKIIQKFQELVDKM